MSHVRSLILASQSPQRKQLLKSLRVPFKIIAADISEATREKNPRRLVSTLAIKKAMTVAKRRRHALVLGADTIVSCRGKILGKPKDRTDALRMLSLLNGRWQRVYTGVALVDSESGRCWKEVTVSRIKTKRLDFETLKRLAGRHLNKAGAYALQDREYPFIEKIVGPTDNVIGLPLASVRSLMRKAAGKKNSAR